MMSLVQISFMLLCYLCLSEGKISEYQLESETLSQCESLRGGSSARQQDHVPQCSEDGRFRHVQCSGAGGECWCVNAEGAEISGSRQNGSAVYCLTSCQLHRQQALLSGDAPLVPQCQASGEYQAVQCDSTRGQCWCVDLEGMELYGTRQNGKPSQCPGSCEVRSRRLLHGVGERSPPQCSADGSFLSVQCKFVNSTDRMVLDLLHTFNRFPKVFQTFSSFRQMFPEVSSYCFCADSRGRELPSTGVELLLDEVYDTAFSGLESGRSFSQTNMYRILQRRFLAIQLAMSGRFRCPSPCESERSAGALAGNVFVASCASDGGYVPTQCQAGGQCWCVDQTGKEIFGTRQHGGHPDCGAGVKDCTSERRQALSRLFSSPSGQVPSAKDSETHPVPSPLSPCSPQLQQLLLGTLGESLSERSDLGDILAETIQGMFPSGAMALKALSLASNPKRLQENLFGGKFLGNAGMFNFTGAVGVSGTLSFSQASLANNQDLVQLISAILENGDFLSTLRQTILLSKAEDSTQLGELFRVLFESAQSGGAGCEREPSALYVPSCDDSGQYQEIQCQGSECWCADRQGQEVTGSRFNGQRPRCPSRCERERAAAQKVKSGQAAGVEVFMPKCEEDGSYVALQCLGKSCFCLDLLGERHATIPSGQTVQCPPPLSPSLPSPGSAPGSCSLAVAEVDQFQEEAERLVLLSNSSHIPLGYSYLLAEGLRLTSDELLHALSSDQTTLLSDRLLSHSHSALRLAAHSTLRFYWQSQQAASVEERPSLLLGYQPYRPQCDAHRQWLPTQCHPSTGQCWCVDEEGGYIPGSLTSRSLRRPQCQTRCQRGYAQALLSDWTHSSYVPTCEVSGQFSVLQKGSSGGAWCVSPVSGETIQPATLSPSGDLTCPSWCQLLTDRGQSVVGYEPECQVDGRLFSPLQCDQTDCWCVSQTDGQELPGTRTPRGTGKSPACDSPQCPSLFSDITVTYGDVVCRSDVIGGQQNCDLICHLGYESTLPVNMQLLCDVETRAWVTEAPLPQACQRLQVLQTVQTSVVLQLTLPPGQGPCSSSLHSSLQTSLLHDMRAQGLCSLQLTSVSVSVCDESSVSVECESEESVSVQVSWRALLSDLPVSVLPDLHDIDVALSEDRLLDGLLGLMGSDPYRSLLTSEPRVLSTSAPNFGCSHGYQRVGTGCVVCPAGMFSSGGVCSPCPQGSYQDQEGSDFCTMCPEGTSTNGASTATQCLTECQRSGLRCSEGGDFLSAQQDIQTRRWRCVTSSGEQLEWTTTGQPLSEGECSVLERFETVPRSAFSLAAEDYVVLSSETSDTTTEKQLRTCVSACAQVQTCLYVVLYAEEGQSHCELYSTDAANIRCQTSEQTKGFLGNAGADMFQNLSCSLKVNGADRQNVTVIRKKGHEFTTEAQKTFERLSFLKASSGVYRTMVFAAEGTTLTDVHRFCQDECTQNTCCDGFILNQNVLSGGTIMCGLLSYPDMLLCSEADWDVSGLAKANRICGAGVTYNKLQKQFIFNFGGQDFTITDTALPTSSKNKTDYQATIIGFQGIYLWKESDMTTRPKTSPACSSVLPQQAPRVVLSDAVKETFVALDSSAVVVDSERDIPSLHYWIFKHQFSAQEAQLWCLKRCEEEELCHLADVRDESSVYFTCALYPDTQVCGAYDKPLRQACSPVLPQQPHTAHTKKVDLTGSVESFYSRVPFKKMVSYSVRSRVNLSDKPITEGFRECERRCDEDPCCRGIGYVRDTQSPGSDVLCLTLNSFGIQTCGEGERTTWRVQDCTPSKVETGVYPLGWYEKPVNQWTKSPRLCPSFQLRVPSKNVSLSEWRLLDASSTLVDPSVSTFDIIHISKDIAEDLDRTRDWCLSACEEAESCVVVSVGRTDSAVRCVLYPDTLACGPSTTTTGGQDCRLVIRESALQVYLHKEPKAALTSVFIPAHGTLQGSAVTTLLGSDRKTVRQFLGVPYARPPIRALRFVPPQPAEWSGTWIATVTRPSCLQPGAVESSASSEDCLYLNIFVPSGIRGSTAVLVFFHNPSGAASDDTASLLDGSYLAAVGNIVVVTVNTRVAAFGFLSTGSTALPGNAGFQDQVAALKWVQENIEAFGGDPRLVTVGAERSGGDVASLHLTSPSSRGLFDRMLLMGGSVFSPASVLSVSKAQGQAEALARELGCPPSSDPEQLGSCLRAAPAQDLNAAQTKLLSVSGPLQAWGPVVDGVSVQGKPSMALMNAGFHRADLLLGSSAEDGLISRAKRIKNFEELQGRADSKTAFYEALSNSLGGDEANAFVKAAATWFYSMQHSPSPAGYNLFSQALNSATRDLFIVCPTIKMANFWAANTRSNVFMYYLPEDTAQTSADLSVPLDVHYAFGLPHSPLTYDLFTNTERRLSLQMMTYMANFIKSGNPNQAHRVSRVAFSEAALPPWHAFQSHPEGDSYMEVEPGLSNHRGLRRPQCSFWADYVPSLTASTGKLSSAVLEGESAGLGAGTPTPETKLFVDFLTTFTQSKPKSEKDAYN
ncbi:thyroglobulin isoform X1 [Oncorhynchus tshawytscha]|uniref:Thyroglobulin n=1 Tax=Oncorhynchus tshawytscha TaxID=74940 RepID=A0AAZ3R2I4_ONCTS|nr:thyroglobulin isoform X1 [Oncorhynchus tshawytscha]